MEMGGGTLMARTRGTPQGGCVSPLLANLFLHYVLDESRLRKLGQACK
jgi:RNA-directed DNA polymerase